MKLFEKFTTLVLWFSGILIMFIALIIGLKMAGIEFAIVREYHNYIMYALMASGALSVVVLVLGTGRLCDGKDI